MRQLFKDAEHLFRMAGLFVIGTSSIIVLRSFLVPADFGLYGHFRAGAIADNASRLLVHAGHETCEICHDTVAATRTGGRHERIGCESCHGALADHAEDPSSVTPEPPAARMLCVRCHRVNGTRPEAFPQVDPDEHAEEMECNECHDPHDPTVE